MYTQNNTFSITDLRHKTIKVLEKAKEQGFVFLVRHSKTEAAVVDADYLKALHEAYEDYLDILEFDKAIKEKGKISLSDYKKKHLK